MVALSWTHFNVDAWFYFVGAFCPCICIETLKVQWQRMAGRGYRWNLLTVGERLGGGGTVIRRSISRGVGGWTRRWTACCDATECWSVRAQIRRRLCCCKQTRTMRILTHLRNDHVSKFKQHIIFPHRALNWGKMDADCWITKQFCSIIGSPSQADRFHTTQQGSNVEMRYKWG